MVYVSKNQKEIHLESLRISNKHFFLPGYQFSSQGTMKSADLPFDEKKNWVTILGPLSHVSQNVYNHQFRIGVCSS